MSLVDLFIWLERTPIAVLIQDTTYLFPAIEVAHLIGLALMYGAILIVDLKLLGFPVQLQPVSRLGGQVAPFASLGMGLMFVTGFPLLASEASKCYENPAFWWKMYFLLPAVVFHFTIRRRVLHAGSAGRVPEVLTGLVSLLLWFGVGLSGRAIAFV